MTRTLTPRLVRRLLAVIGIFLLIIFVLTLMTAFPMPSRNIGILSADASNFVSSLFAAPARQNFFERLFGLSPLWQSERVCVGVEQNVLWNPGDEATALTQHLKDTMQVFVDEVQLAPERLLFEQELTTVAQLDSFGQVRGTSGATLSACFLTGGLPAGDHTVRLVLSRTNGETYVFNWMFGIR